MPKLFNFSKSQPAHVRPNKNRKLPHLVRATLSFGRTVGAELAKLVHDAGKYLFHVNEGSLWIGRI